jgi:tetratricopeptide (TPR) repeat protein
VPRHEQIRRRQLLREAEGYLDLATVFSGRWELDTGIRDQLARRALAQLQRARKLGGDSIEAFYLEGEALRAMQQWSEAVKPLEAARSEDGSSIHIHLALAWCYKRLGKLDLAIEALEEALSIDPTEAILYYNLACYWSLAGNARLAVNYLTEAFDLDPDYRDLVGGEEDFDPIRNHPAFKSLTTVIV